MRIQNYIYAALLLSASGFQIHAENVDYEICIPSDASLQLGIKSTHFTDFQIVEPSWVETSGKTKTFRYSLDTSKTYNYRCSKPEGLTHAGYFKVSANEAGCPKISFNDSDFQKHSPKDINHSPKSNGGYETGDIFVNINPEGHLKLKKGEVYHAHAMRTWQLTDNSVNNYFFEPDFHYTVLDTEGKPSDGIIEISQKEGSPWVEIKALEPGTAIVLVAYDGINLNYYSGAAKKEYLGGEYWGAIWPENTAVYVVTVDEEESSAVANMVINEKYNEEAKKNAGKYVDAEHDVFYYLDSEQGYIYTFRPENVVKVEVAYPTIGKSVSYNGFSTQGVTKNDDSYSVLLKKGRQIIRLTDAEGHSIYQVLTAKECNREITNVSREGSRIFQPGDQVKIQYNGLFHPANKLAGIYNMSAYVTYNGKPNGSSLIEGSGQYTFGSAPAAQAVTIEIPVDFDIDSNPSLIMNEGVIQVNGFGDPIGNHRIIDKEIGRSPNFNAVAHKTYFGAIPDVVIPLSAYKTFKIAIANAPANVEVEISYNGSALKPDGEGLYEGTYGKYNVTAKAEGYRCLHTNYEIGDEADGLQTFNVTMEELNGAWDGKTLEEPDNEDGKYLIGKPSELAWFAQNVNSKGKLQDAVLTNDLHLGNFDWTPIGISSSAPFTGHFDGNGHTISGLYINTKTNYMGLFGYVKDANLERISIEGKISAKQYVGGLAGYAAGASSIDRCANHAEISGSGTYVGGLVGDLYAASGTVTNSFNTGDVTGTTNCGGVIGANYNKDSVIKNIFNTGKVKGSSAAACVGGTKAKTNMCNAYSIYEYEIVDGQTTVSEENMRSGEIAYLLGDAFSQTLGIHEHPVFDGLKVYYDADKDKYYNIKEADDLKIETSELTIDIKSNPIVEISATHGPEYSVVPEVIWRSSDEETVSIEHDGSLKATLTAHRTGNATISVEHKDNPNIKDSCNVIVTTSSGIIANLNIDENASVEIYDFNGRVISTNAKVSYLNKLSKGLYIVRYNNEDFKILIK